MKILHFSLPRFIRTPSGYRRAGAVIILLFLPFLQAGYGADPPVVVVSYKGKRVELNAERLAKLPGLEVQAAGHGEKHLYGGVLVREVLALVDAPLGDSFRGDAVAMVVRVRAADGYVAAFALAEFDSDFSNRTILLAYRQDGAPLPEGVGPFRIVIPEDKRPTRWVRQVMAIDIIPSNKAE